MFENFPVYNSV